MTIQNLVFLLSNPEILFTNKKYLFIISHMRSRSSVLSHILGSNPEIYGYKELQRSYENRKSLMNMQIELMRDLKLSAKNSYFLDKILHNYNISDSVLNNKSLKIIFLLREPKPTIQSIINLGINLDWDWYKVPEKVTDYYCERLENIEQLVNRLKGNYLFIESNDLVEDTDATLLKISNWLNLKEKLIPEYKLFRDTGISGAGDPLNNILSGELIKTKGYDDIEVPNDLLEKANISYERCKNILLKQTK